MREIDITAPIRSCAIINTGRTGSDLLQSLFDSHPNVLTFNGALYFYKFWKASKCVAKGNFSPCDLIDEFIGIHIHQLKSRYDWRENKDRLGKSQQDSVSIDTAQFRSSFLRLLGANPPTSRNIMVAIYYAYAECLGQDIMTKTLLLHHLHWHEGLPPYLSDFPDSKAVVTIRDPRANFVSGIVHRRKESRLTDREMNLYGYIKRIMDTSFPSFFIDNYNLETYTIRLEDMGDLRSLCNWLDIPYTADLEYSTFGGLQWHGDKRSPRQSKTEGYDKSMLDNKWQEVLPWLDKYRLNYLMHNFLVRYNYAHTTPRLLDTVAMFFILCLPLRFELRFFALAYLLTYGIRIHLSNIKYYLLRVGLFYRHYFKCRRIT